MNTLNRFLIMCMLFGLLYALYRYQQLKTKKEDGKDKDTQKEQNKELTQTSELTENKRKEPHLIDDESIDRISVDNVSQISLGSLGDLKTEVGGYKPDSVLESLDSKDTVDTNGTLSIFNSKESKKSNFFP